MFVILSRLMRVSRAKKICYASKKGFSGQAWPHEYKKVSIGDLLASLEKKDDLISTRDSWLVSLDIPEYQRDAIWPSAFKQGLVRSIFLGLPVDPLKVVPGPEDGTFRLVDGLQRSSTLSGFVKNEFGVPDLFSQGAETVTYFTSSAEAKGANSASEFLDAQSQNLFKSYLLDVVVIDPADGALTDPEIQERERLLFDSSQQLAPQNVSEQIFFLGTSGKPEDNFWREVVVLSEELSPFLNSVILPDSTIRGETTRYLSLLGGLLLAEAVWPEGEGQVYPLFKPLNYERMQTARKNGAAVHRRYSLRREEIVSIVGDFCGAASQEEQKVSPERFLQIYKEMRSHPSGAYARLDLRRLPLLLAKRDFFDLLAENRDSLSLVIRRLQEALAQKNGVALNEWRDSLLELVEPAFARGGAVKVPATEKERLRFAATCSAVEDFTEFYCWEDKTLLETKRKRAEKVLWKLRDLSARF